MKNIRKILFPTDLSELSFAAVEMLTSVAELYRAEVYVVHVLESFPGLKPGKGVRAVKGDVHAAERSAKRVLDDLEQRAHLSKVVNIIRQGDPRTEIVRCARELGVDLIVMATHGRTGISHVLLGSVAEQVVRYAPVPVLTVKPQRIAARIVEQGDIDEQLHVPSRP